MPRVRAGNADGGHAGAHRHLAHDERGATGRAAGLTVVVGEQDAVLGDAVDVGRAAHHAVRVSADVPHADVIAQDDDDVGLLLLRVELKGRCQHRDADQPLDSYKVLHAFSMLA